MLTGHVPSLPMTKISDSPSRLEIKAIIEPSGDQDGDLAWAHSSVRMTGFDPSAFITTIWALSSSPSRTNAIWDPVGDHVGWRPFASFCRCAPSASITTISPPLQYSLLLPSGERAGDVGEES